MALFCPKDFREYATVQMVSEVSDGAGGYSDTWSERVGIWCIVDTIAGGEGVISGRLEHSESFVLTTHYNSEILDTDRIDLEGDLLKITRVEDIDRKQEFMRIYAETGRT